MKSAGRGERELATFAHEMRRKLAANADKGGWKQESELWLLARLSEEVAELEAALYAHEGYPDPDAVRSECADVANFAMMIADVCGALES